MKPWYYPSERKCEVIEESAERLLWVRRETGQLVEGRLAGNRFHIRELK